MAFYDELPVIEYLDMSRPRQCELLATLDEDGIAELDDIMATEGRRLSGHLETPIGMDTICDICGSLDDPAKIESPIFHPCYFR